MDAEREFAAYVGARLSSWSRAAFLLTGDRHQAEDLVQITCELLARYWERATAHGDPEPYARRIMFSRHVSMRRRRRHDVELYATPPDQVGAEVAGATERAVMVRDALARLAPGQRAVLVLRFFEDLTEAQTADVLRCSVSTVKSQTRDALARLLVLAPELRQLIEEGAR